MSRTAMFALVCLGSCLGQQARLGFGGAIDGTVTGDGGEAIVGGYVTAYLLTSDRTRAPKTEWRTATGVGGAFRVAGLGAGDYRLCVEVQNNVWLNPCEWSFKSAPIISISADRPAAAVSIVLKRGVALRVRLDDPAQLMDRNVGRTPGAHLMLGVPNESQVLRVLPVVSKDGTGRNHQIVVPFDYPVKLVISSSFFRLSDAAGKPLAAGVTHIPLSFPSGATPAPTTFRVSGGS